jgi:hypothetical protein
MRRIYFPMPKVLAAAWAAARRALWGGFLIFHFSDPTFVGAVGRFPHFLLFRPNFCWRRGAVSSFFAFPTQLLLAPRGGFLIFCFSDPTFVGAAGRFPHFLLFRPNFC